MSFTPNSNYMWSNNSIGSVQINWEISRQTIENVPYQNGTLTYNGNEQSPVWNNYDAEKLTITGSTTEVNAGDYDTLLKEAHTLKGVAGTLGLLDVYQSSSEIVTALRSENTESIPKLVEKLQQAYEKTIAVLCE